MEIISVHLHFKRILTMKRDYFFKTVGLAFIMLLMTPVFHSCKKGKNGPDIRNVIFFFHSDSSFLQGDYIRFSFELSDEVEVKSYLISIVPEAHSGNPLSYITKHRDLPSGADITIKDSIWLSEEAEVGNYYFQIGATNANGYSADLKLKFKVSEQENNPLHFTISDTPDPQSTYVNGDTLRIHYVVTDDSASLQDIKVYLSPPSGLQNGYENAICMFASGPLSNVASDTLTAHIIVGSPYDNNIPPQAISSWDIDKGYIVARAENAIGNIKYSKHLPVTTHDTLP